MAMPKTTRIERITIISPDTELVNEMRRWLRPYSSFAQIDGFNSLRAAVPVLAKVPCGLMLVSDRFPEASGLSLFDGLHRLSPDAQIFMLASEQTPIPGVSIAARRETSLHYFPQPWDQESLLAHLEASLGDERPFHTTPLTLGDSQHLEVSRHLDELQESVSARSIYLTTDLGQVLAYKGDTELAQIEEISSLLGGSFVALQQVGRTLGDYGPANSLIQHQSETEELYVLGVGDHALLVMLFSHNPNTPRIGTVAYYARNKVEALAKILSSDLPGQAPEMLVAGIGEALDTEFDKLFAKPKEDTKELRKSTDRLDFAKALEEGLVTRGLIDRFRAAGGRTLDRE